MKINETGKFHILLIGFIIAIIILSCGNNGNNSRNTELDRELSELSKESNSLIDKSKGETEEKPKLTSIELGYIRDLRIIPRLNYQSEQYHIKGRILKYRNEISNIIKNKLRDEGITTKEKLVRERKRLENEIKDLINEFLIEKYQTPAEHIKEFSLSDL
jgi:hypothetical protein